MTTQLLGATINEFEGQLQGSLATGDFSLDVTGACTSA
jgi:hypothetical protein